MPLHLTDTMWLVIRGVDPAVWSRRIKARRQTIGRAADCAIRVLDDTVSRRHAEIWRRGGAVFVRDLKSRNGTFLDGDAISRCTLVSGKSLKVGDITLDLLVGPTPGEAKVRRRPDSTTVEHKGGQAAHVLNVGKLSDAQRHVLRLLLKGISEKRVAASLSVSYHTVHSHVKHIYRQFGVQSRAELMALYLASQPG